MSERYERVYTLKKDDYSHIEGCPVRCIGGGLLYDTQKQCFLCTFKFRNVSDKVIDSITIQMMLYDNSSNLLKLVNYTYNNLEIEPLTEYGDKRAIIISSHDVCRVLVKIVCVGFKDGDIEFWESENARKLRNNSSQSVIYCPKCGVTLSCNSVFCSSCGAKVHQKISEEKTIGTDSSSYAVKKNESKSNKQSGHKYLKLFLGVVFIGVIMSIVLPVVTSFVLFSSSSCKYENCFKERVDGSSYCFAHCCKFPDCNRLSGSTNNYCISHRCMYTVSAPYHSSCDKPRTLESIYCTLHTCANDGCRNSIKDNSLYCNEHQIDIKKRLGKPSFGFSLNSANGVVFNFNAKNNSGKTIKYVRFKVYYSNAVGDSLQDDITQENYASVEIIGPIDNGKDATMNKEVIGYCDNLYCITIRDVAIVYMDGTSETGAYNYRSYGN